MSKYKKGDKVVIRKDLVVGECYGGFGWYKHKEYMKKKDYVVIEKVDSFGDYRTEGGCFITEGMIAGLYVEEDSMKNKDKPKYKIGDKVVIRKDLEVDEYYGECYWSDDTEYMKDKEYVVIEEVDEDGDYLVGGEWYINDEMISHKYGDFNSKNQLDYNEIEYVNYKMQHEDLHQSIYKYNLQCQIDKALDENNTELLIELSNLMKGGVMIDN